MRQNHQIQKNRKFIGHLLQKYNLYYNFEANWVRYDVSFAASQLARFCASAGVSHWATLHHVMGYLNNNPSFKLVYQRGHYNGLGGFADADWGNSESRRSTTGLLARYNNSIVLWRSRYMISTAISDAE